jgi:membrane protein DedA with SNARE-associated domain
MNSLAYIEQFRYLGLFGLLVLGGVGFPFPEDITFILAGILVAHAVVLLGPAFLAVYSGVLIADLILYFLGRTYGRKVAECRPFAKMLSPERLTLLERRFCAKGVRFILFGRHLPGLRIQLFLVAGIMRMSLLRFLLADAFTALFSVTIWGGVGYVGGYKILAFKGRFARVENSVILPAVAMGALVGIIYILFWYGRGKRRNICRRQPIGDEE